MQQLQIPKWFESSFAYLLPLVLLGATFNGLDGFLGQLADASILFGLAFGSSISLIHFALTAKILRRLSQIYLSSLMFLLAYVVTLPIVGFDQQALFVVAELMLVLGFFYGVTQVRWERTSLGGLGYFATIFILAIFVSWIFAGNPSHFSAYLSNKNALGGVLYGLLFFVLILHHYEQKWIFLIIFKSTILIGAIALIATNSRASLLAFITMGATYFFTSFIGKSRLRWGGFFFLVMLFVLGFSIIYSSLNDFLPTDELSGTLMDYTGGRLYSGRNEIWPALQELIVQRPFLGYGAGARPSDFLDTELSSHNFYYQISLQVGLLGLFLVLFVLWAIWMTLWFRQNDRVVRFSSAYMIGFIVHQIFEVSMTQNNLAVGMLQWLILGIGISRITQSTKRASYYSTFKIKKAAIMT